MNTKILLIAFSAFAITSCSTAYKSAQTPDDVYYSPVRMVDEKQDNSRREETRETYNADDSRTRMAIRDRRWRDLNDEYDYTYRNSPYNYSYCNCACNTGYGYYYNPFFYPRPLYQTTIVSFKPAVNTTPRSVNLNAYKNYNQAVTYNPKSGTITGASISNSGGSRQTRQYNNSNNQSKVGRVVREVLTPDRNSNRSSSSENNTRSYTPSTPSSGSSSGGSSSGGSSSGGSVSRPGRG